MLRLVVIALAVTCSGSSAWAQDEGEKTHDAPDRIQYDFSFDYEPAELHDNYVETLRWKRLWGPVGIAGYHIYPAAETGPYAGPPLRFWSNGWGTSLWRDPVTGWPLQ